MASHKKLKYKNKPVLIFGLAVVHDYEYCKCSIDFYAENIVGSYNQSQFCQNKQVLVTLPQDFLFL